MQNNQKKIAKSTLREKMAKKIRNCIDSDLGQNFQNTFATNAKNRLCNDSAFVNADIILGYYPLKYEASCLEILQTSLNAEKKVLLPKIDKSTITFHFCNSLTVGTFTKNAYGIYEPTTDQIDFSNLQLKDHVNILAIVPGLAFTRSGKRLGRGKGYYDKFFTELFRLQEHKNMTFSITLVGLCFSFQIVDKMPTEEHDVPMNYILSENEYTFVNT